jgi:hypothetical protein
MLRWHSLLVLTVLIAPCTASTIRTETAVYSTPFGTSQECANLGGEFTAGESHWAGSCAPYSAEARATASASRVEAKVATWSSPGAPVAYALGAFAHSSYEQEMIFLGASGHGAATYQFDFSTFGNGFAVLEMMGFRCEGISCVQLDPSPIEFNVPFLLRIEAEAYGNSVISGLSRAVIELLAVVIRDDAGSVIGGARMARYSPRFEALAQDTEVPEPAAWVLTFLGLIGVVMLSRKTTQ